MATHQIRRLPVINRQKRLVGVVALADISRADDECGQDALKDISAPAARERH
jgi:CBS-domain-containing membrane protein